MRLSLRPANPLEYLALRANLVPRAAAEAWGGVAATGVLAAAARAGVFVRLAQGPAPADKIAADLGLESEPTELLLGCLHAAGYLTLRRGRYRIARRERRWLDPGSPLGVGAFVDATGDYFDWWRDLGEVLRSGRPVDHHDVPPEDPYWRRYMLGQRDLARLSAVEVASRLDLERPPRRILDVGGGHGLYSAALCHRYPEATATVLDLPGAVEAARGTLPASVRDRVSYIAGDARTAELPGDQDLVLCFNLVHHLREPEIRALLARVHAALAPDGTLAVLDAFAEPARRGDQGAACLGMFMFLSSGSRVFTPRQLAGWLVAAGFAAPRVVPVRRVPGLALYRARRLPGVGDSPLR